MVSIAGSMEVSNVQTNGGFKAQYVYFNSIYNPGRNNDFKPFCVVVLPPEYESEPESRFPVIYNFHGQTSHPREDIYASDVFGTSVWSYDLAYIQSVKKRPVILVSADGNMNDGGNSFYEGANGYSFENYLAKELLDSIDKNFRTIPSRKGRALCGYSMGGYGSAHIGQTFPSLFCCAATYAGAFNWMGVRNHNVRAQNFLTVPFMMNEYIGAMLWSNNAAFDTLLTNAGVPHRGFFPSGSLGGHTSCIPGCSGARTQTMDFYDSCFAIAQDNPETWNYLRTKPYAFRNGTNDTIQMFGNRFVISQSRFDSLGLRAVANEHFASLHVLYLSIDSINMELLEWTSPSSNNTMEYNAQLLNESITVKTGSLYNSDTLYRVTDSILQTGIKNTSTMQPGIDGRLTIVLNGAHHILQIRNFDGSTINRPPFANAGYDQTITLPVNSLFLQGKGADNDGTISFAWNKISGGNATIVSPTDDTTEVTGLNEGEYEFEFVVTDDRFSVARDTVVVIVEPEKLFIVDSFFVIADNELDVTAPDAARGARSSMRLKSGNQGILILDFDLASLTATTIDSGKIILKTATGTTTTNYSYSASIMGITAQWQESTSTYNNTQTGTNWPGNNPNNSFSSSGVQTTTFSGTRGDAASHVFPVSGDVVVGLKNGVYHGIVIKETGSSYNNVDFYTKEQSGGYGAILEVYTSEFLPSGILSEKKDDIFLSICPNPFNPVTNITVRSAKGKYPDIKVSIYDLNGRLVKTMEKPSSANASLLTFSWDASKNPSGLYVVKTSVGKKLCSKKMVLMK